MSADALMQIDLDHPSLSTREREGIELMLTLHRIYKDQKRMRESYTAALGAMRLWHLWTRDIHTNQPSTMPGKL